MAEIEQTLATYLKAYAGLAALIGTRIYPLVLPQNPDGGPPTLPACTFQRISGARAHNQNGRTLLARPRIQIDCWAATYSAAKGVAAQVRAALDGHQGAGDAWGSYVDADLDDYDADTGRYRVVVDVVIIHAP